MSSMRLSDFDDLTASKTTLIILNIDIHVERGEKQVIVPPLFFCFFVLLINYNSGLENVFG